MNGSIIKIAIVTLFIISQSAIITYAKSNDELSLIVTSDGSTKDEAIKNALRSAIEQAYGVFVSSNTSILNDELIADEIATVSSGNIKKYEEIAYSKIDDKHTVTLNAVVSRGKLLSYAKSKGSECELDGDAMFRDIELQQLYKKNEEKLFANLIEELRPLFQHGYDYKLEINRVSESTTYFRARSDNSDNVCCFDCHITALLNQQGEFAWKKLIETLETVGEKGPKSSKHDESFCYGIEFFTGSTAYSMPESSYRVRSSISAKQIYKLIKDIPNYIKNIRFDINGEKINLYNLKLYKDYHTTGDAEVERYNIVCSYRRKKGNDCGQFRYRLCVPTESLKGLKSVKVETRD